MYENDIFWWRGRWTSTWIPRPCLSRHWIVFPQCLTLRGLNKINKSNELMVVVCWALVLGSVWFLRKLPDCFQKTGIIMSSTVVTAGKTEAYLASAIRKGFSKPWRLQQIWNTYLSYILYVRGNNHNFLVRSFWRLNGMLLAQYQKAG